MSTPGGSPESYTARKRGAVSLRTTRLCPAGVQPWFIDCITAGADKIAYCATLAIYIFQKNTYSLYRVINAHSNTITSLSFSPAHLPRVVSCIIGDVAVHTAFGGYSDEGFSFAAPRVGTFPAVGTPSVRARGEWPAALVNSGCVWDPA